jgi:Putative restriction endonuclease
VGATVRRMALAEIWRWDEESFILAWEAGVFRDERVELVEGEVWPVSIGLWHGAVTSNIVRALPDHEWRVTTASLPASGSVPDPDVWVHRREARPIARIGATGRLARWDPSDVALVVEVADSSLGADLDTKARIYGRAGYPIYWVAHHQGVEVLTEPYEAGYRHRRSFVPGDHVPVPYRDDRTIAVDELLDAEP